MSLQKYAALLRTVELGSVSLAAEQMGYTQPAVSRMIADLEREWGVELLYRSRAGIVLTSAGEKLLPLVEAVLADHEELQFTVNELKGLHTGLVRVGTFTSVANKWVPMLLKSFEKQYPGIEFKLVNSENYAEIEDWILRGKVDCGFVNMPVGGDIDVHFLRRDRLVAVLPKDHPLVDEPFYPISRLPQERFIKLREEEDTELSDFLSHLPAPPRARYEVNDDHMILSMVEAGLGMSVMHSLLFDLGRYDVVWKDFDMQQPRSIGIATQKHGRITSATRLFIEHARRELSSIDHVLTDV